MDAHSATPQLGQCTESQIVCHNQGESAYPSAPSENGDVMLTCIPGSGTGLSSFSVFRQCSQTSNSSFEKKKLPR
jgi:hypothetical protein